MGLTARERFHQQLQQGNEATTQEHPVETQREQGARVLSAEGLRAMAALAAAVAKTEKRRTDLHSRINALGVPMTLAEMPTEPGELAELERTVADLERGE